MGSAENGGFSIWRPKGAKLVHPPWDVFDTFPNCIQCYLEIDLMDFGFGRLKFTEFILQTGCNITECS